MDSAGGPGTLEYLGVEPRRAAYTLLDLFAGAGGLSLGLGWAGFAPQLAVESDAAAASSYEANFGPHVARSEAGAPLEVGRIDFSAFRGRIDLLAGGPPCQGFSQLGARLAGDPRNALWREYLRAVAEVRPRAFLLENVPPMLKSAEGRAAVLQAQSLGYGVACGVLNAEAFGVPQKRRRAFLLGLRGGAPSLPPRAAQRPRDVRWALAGLPLEPDGRNWHLARNPTPTSLVRYRAVPEGGNRFDLMRSRPDLTPRCWSQKKTGSTDVFGRLWWDRPALTVRTEFYKPEKGRYLHPSEDRPITHREAARLQTFPDDFRFVGSRTQVAAQIGNAVPPLLAYHLGLHLRGLLEAD